uniref:Uncharacterized protein n=1 Tax=Palpitomonas bilix TaxID=652834 RepID=A0A7S3G8L7_9EUKA|mmetsp:Transcript_28482/g.72584  ORF Transcript_28482/g.72584 Transcript_28482/m.72584 type:complete len:116 (+) Transcript_28482:274-621(+)
MTSYISRSTLHSPPVLLLYLSFTTDTYHSSGMIFLQNGDFRRGLPTLDASITYMSNLPASAHSFLAGPDAGVMQLPAFSQILYNAGMARQQMGRPDLALPLFVRAIELDSTFSYC